MTYSLICEGPCNPYLPAVDAAVRDERKRTSLADRGPLYPVSDSLVKSLRALKHTPHDRLTHSSAVCVTCSTSRRYGREE